MKRLVQVSKDLENKLKVVETDEQLSDLGFKPEKRLCEYEGFKEFSERLWVWSKVENDKVYIIVMMDAGNGFGAVAYYDVYIKEVIDEHNQSNK